MIGRQEIHLPPDELVGLFSQFGHLHASENNGAFFGQRHCFSEPLFEFLGASSVDSFDYSDFEGATWTHDMNESISEGFKSRYSMVFDGGSLEHIFNFPTAIKNCMEMVEPGGDFIGCYPANNYMGHGFYQFSPELFFRVFCQQNGFDLPRIFVFEDTPRSPWYEVIDPVAAGSRVVLRSVLPVQLLVIARKSRTLEVFGGGFPQQSDYDNQWAKNERANVSRDSGSPLRERTPLLKRIIRASVPLGVRKIISLRHKEFDPRYYKRVEF